MKLTHKKGLFYGLIGTGFALCSCTQKQEKPNIVLIFTDDQGYGDLGCYGAEDIQTPTIDSLAENGIRFTNFYVSQAVSSASRASLLTGCYANRVGIGGALTPNADFGIAPEELTMAEMLKQAGYTTGAFGKWHLGDHEKFLPLQHGFDEYVGLPYSNDMWPVGYDNKPSKNKSRYPELKLIEGNVRTQSFHCIEDQDSITTLLTRKAVDFVHRNADQPFFLYFPHPMPHVPLGVSEKFAGKSEYGRYGDVIMEIDWSVKQVVEALKKAGIDDNTLIIFTSDNGPWKNMGDHGGTTAGLREGKGSSWEGGHRVPCVMTWPGVIPKNLTINNMASTMDILPTLAEIAGADLPEKKIDGVNIMSLLEGDTLQHPRTELFYYYHDNDLEAVRSGDWKLVFPHVYRSYEGVEPGKNGMPGKYNYGESDLELYNLKTDPFEEMNCIDSYPDIKKTLEAKADSMRVELGDFLTGEEGNSRRNPGFLFEIEDQINHKGLNARINLGTEYHLKYSGRGDKAMIDGKIARPSFRDRAWQAYFGEDMEAIIELENAISIDSVIVSTLKDEKSWVFLPESMEVFYSMDGVNFKSYGAIRNEAHYRSDIGKKYLAVFNKDVEAKFIKVSAKNIGTCPEGHVAAGKPAWIFFDEIILK
jgi:arylsulfatase